MAETPQQPDPDEVEEQSLEAQLDDLLARIEEQEPGIVASAQQTASRNMEAEPTPEPAPAEPASVPAPAQNADNPLDELIDTQVDEAIAEAEQVTANVEEAAGIPEAEAETSAGDDLSNQLQALLNDAAQAAESVDASSPSEPTSGPPPAGEEKEDVVAEALAEVTADMDAKAPAADQPIASAAADQADETETVSAQAASDETADKDIASLDQILADSADEAVAGEFETIEQVVTPPAESAETDETQTGDVKTEAVAANEALPANSFESPQQVQQTDAPQDVAVGATASDVAAELDTQPESLAPAPVSIQATPAKPIGRLERWANKLPHRAMIEQIALQTCAVINKPLNHLSPQSRNTVGYAGLLTVHIAIAIILVAIIF